MAKSTIAGVSDASATDRLQVNDPDASIVDSPAAGTEGGYADWSYRDLQHEATRRDLPATGSTEELRERLAADDADKAAAAQ